MRVCMTFFTALLIGSGGPLFAQGSAPDLVSAIELEMSRSAVSDVRRADLNLDGLEEALLLHSEGCDGPACPWTLISAYPDGSGWGPVAAGYGARTELVETDPSGQVISSDGVIMAWDGASLKPYFDLLALSADRRASASEARLIGGLMSEKFRPLSTRVYEFDPYESGEVWKLFLRDVSGMTAEGLTRFHLLGPDDRVHHSGDSDGRPWIYADRDAAGEIMRVVSLTRSGLLVESVR